MKRCSRFLVPGCAGLMALAALGGCASPEALPSYYVLDPAADRTAGEVGSHHGVRLFLRRVALPGYLQSTKIASRRGDSQIEYAPTAFWASGLPKEFGRALAETLSRRPEIGAVNAPPVEIPPPRDYDLVVEVERFEGDDHGDVILEVRWQLCRPESAVPLLSRQNRFVQTGWTYGDEAGQARRLSEDVRDLAAQIAQAAKH